MAVTPLDPPYLKTPCYTQTPWRYLLQTRFTGDRSLQCGNRNFRSFLLLWPWPWPDDLHIQTRPIFPGDTPDVQIWTSYIKAMESYRLTDKHTVRQVTRGHFRSRDKDGCHTIRSTVFENRMLRANLITYFLCYRTGVMGDRSLHCGNRYFLRFRLLWLWPWPDELHIRTWPVLPGDIPDAKIWSSYVKAFESYRLTDRHTARQTEWTEL